MEKEEQKKKGTEKDKDHTPYKPVFVSNFLSSVDQKNLEKKKKNEKEETTHESDDLYMSCNQDLSSLLPTCFICSNLHDA